ncbi:hypothetical protein [Amycolatopsis pretoriensis]|uniref:hypothetical protein n=1 Tax=Amycolatopsis pretoriensis TaxID=218821 RepID=UPI001ABFAA0D|nr:hypothetical protein [Amycolatopsis pretoriensis]
MVVLNAESPAAAPRRRPSANPRRGTHPLRHARFCPDIHDRPGDVSSLSVGAIYRYFKGKDKIVAAVCEQSTQALPTDLTAESVRDFLEHIRTMAREEDHARLVAHIYA